MKDILLVVLALSTGGAVFGQSIEAPYSSSYTLVNLGTPGGVPSPYGGVAFLNPSTLLLEGSSNGSGNGAIYAIPVTRAANGHITALGGGTYYASAADNYGLASGPGGVLFASDEGDNELLEYLPGANSPSLTIALGALGVSAAGPGALQFVPQGMPGAGLLKMTTPSCSPPWYDVTLTPNGNGTYGISVTQTSYQSTEAATGITYVPPASPQFSAASVLVSNWCVNTVVAYPVDADGNPSSAGNTFMSLYDAMGATYDPITGDAIIVSYGSGVVTETQGFTSGAMSASAGSQQTAVVDTAFGVPLTVTLNDPFGQPVSGVTVDFTAPASGARATLSASSAVTGANGQATITATANATSGSYSVSASAYALSASFSLTNTALSALTLSPTAVTGGDADTNNTVTLTSPAPASGATITLKSSKPATAAVPASVTVSGGQTVSAPFSITTTAVISTEHVTISASDGTDTKTAKLTVKPAALTFVKLSPKSTTGGKSTTGNTVVLNGPAPAGGATVNLSSGDSSAASTPTSVTIAAGSTTSPAFTITTSPVASDTPVIISASYGSETKTASLTVNAPVLYSLKLSPASVTGGHSTRKNKVTLNGAAPSGGAAVMLTSGDSPVASPPMIVTVPAGSTSAEFTITTTGVSSSLVVPITASFGGVTKSADLTVNP